MALNIILQSLSLFIFTKISWSTINFKTENGSRLITEYYAFTIRVDEVIFLGGGSRLVAEYMCIYIYIVAVSYIHIYIVYSI